MDRSSVKPELNQSENKMVDFSIIIPAYNEEEYITRLLDCILVQDYPSLKLVEIIVVNNNSTDKTEEVVKSFGKKHPQLNLKIINESRKGVNYARNAGGKLAKGEILIFLDADNLIESDFLSQVEYEYLNSNSMAGTFFTLPDNNSSFDKILFRLLSFIKIVFKRPFGKVYVTRFFFEEIDHFDESLIIGTTTDFNTRLKKYLQNNDKKYLNDNIKIYTSVRRFRKMGYFYVLLFWLLGYIGIRKTFSYF